MHEFSLAQSIVNIATTHAARNGAVRITKVGVMLGVVSHVAPVSLDHSFKLARQGTPAQCAELIIRRVPLAASCMECKQNFKLETSEPACPHCGSSLIRLLQELELTVEYIEVDD